MQRSTHVLVIGGGVIGCSIAYYLAKEGVEVEVVDRGDIGGQASSAAAGLLAPLLPFASHSPEFVRLLLASFALFPALIPDLEDESGIPIHYEQTGTLRTASSTGGLRRLQQSLAVWESWGFEVSLREVGEVLALEPGLTSRMCGAVYAPQEGQLKAPALVNAFARAASLRGVRFVQDAEVVGLKENGASVTAVITARGDTIFCDHVIAASGAWSGLLGALLSLEVPVQPVRGQVIALRQPSLPVRHIIFGEGIYIAPKTDGTLLVGATKEHVGFNTGTTDEGVAWLRRQATRLIPALESSELVSAWAGLRPKTPGGQPILGMAPHWENVTLATGHNAFGVTLSPITGQMIAQQVMMACDPELIRPFSPSYSLERQPRVLVLPGA